MRAFIDSHVRSEDLGDSDGGAHGSSDGDEGDGDSTNNDPVRESREDLDSISGGGASGVDEDYYLVSIPTMGTDFNVHHKQQ
ncbi:hypothetical protein EON63_09595 [archaeon]|nr:MAG: hypothetical protein EON63_09595 [archaeon]